MGPGRIQVLLSQYPRNVTEHLLRARPHAGARNELDRSLPPAGSQSNGETDK